MRLIDEAVLINEAETGGWDVDIKELKMILKYVPTVDAAPVVHGEWVLQGENEPLTRCENCTHWDKSISFMMSAHACSYWSPSKRSPRYTEGFEFCSFASAKPERSEGNEVRSD